jgi:hypothetical protein
MTRHLTAVEHEPHANEDLLIYSNRGKVAIWTAVGLGLIVEGIYVVLSTTSGVHLIMRILVVAPALAIAGTGMAVLVSKLCSSKPRIVFSHEGILLASTLVGLGVIRWSEIEGLIAYRALAQMRLRIILKDPDAIADRQGQLQRILYPILKGGIRTSRSLVTADGMLSMSIDAMLIQVRERFQRELVQNKIFVSGSQA